MNDSKSCCDLTIVFRLGVFLCFSGWAWGHLYLEAPYGALIWHESTYEIAEDLGFSWDEFVGTGADDGLVQTWIGRIGWLYVACAVLSLTVRKGRWLQIGALIGGCGLLSLLSYAKYVAAQEQLPMLIEQGGQILMPLLLVLAVSIGITHRATVITAIVAVIMTFAGHGCYAFGLWPTPGTFYAMTSVILGVEYETANTILRVAGILDFLVCFAILLPWTRRSAALYAATWGFLTAIARPVAGMSTSLYYCGADLYLHESILRAPHFMIPLYLLLVWRPKRLDTSTH